MNKDQTRLLLETEFHFYRLGESELTFMGMLVRLGYKPKPDLAKLDNSALKKLNFRLRTLFRSPRGILL